MNATLCVAAFLVIAQPEVKERQPHPLAPSLPRLTKEESKIFDDIIERFIQYDIGKLKGEAGMKALEDFKRLPPESIFNLISGLNRAANMESSCPAVLIAKKVNSTLSSSEDLELLKFAQANIGADVTAKRHLGVLQDLKLSIIFRKGALQRKALAAKSNPGVPKAPSAMSLAELETAMSRASSPQLRAILTEVEKRQGMKAVDLLIAGIVNEDMSLSKWSQGLLAKNIQRQGGDVLKLLIKHDRNDVRIAAADAVGKKKLRYGGELIALLQDSDENVRQAGHRALLQIAGGSDYGADAERWREWWSRQKQK
jgi:HEAT repeat protein